MSNYHGNVEFFTGGLVRVFDGANEYGDPYEYCLPFRAVDAGTVEVCGVIRNRLGQNNLPTLSQWRAMREAFSRHGLKVIYRRRAGANPGVREVS